MGTALTTIEPIPLPALERPAQMPSLPAWLQRRSDALATADKVHYRPRPKLPASLILSPSERAAVDAHIAALSRFLDLSQMVEFRDKALTNDQAHSAMIAGVLTRKGGKVDAAMSEQLTEEYLDAIEDLPAWCVREALRKWNRGESVHLDKRPHNFEFRPEPATLARLARIERGVVQHRINQMQRLSGAEPEQEFTEEHQAEMRAKLSTLPIIGPLIKLAAPEAAE